VADDAYDPSGGFYSAVGPPKLTCLRAMFTWRIGTASLRTTACGEPRHTECAGYDEMSRYPTPTNVDARSAAG